MHFDPAGVGLVPLEEPAAFNDPFVYHVINDFSLIATAAAAVVFLHALVDSPSELLVSIMVVCAPYK
jgi:hypothetical protein